MTDLIKRSKKGDKEAFALLMDMHRQMLYNTALLVLHQEDDALDAIQDAILACWENLPTLRKDQYFKTWLVKILLNKCRDIQRSQSHYAFVEELPESEDEPDWDTHMDVGRAMGRLGDQDQLILSLFYYGRLPRHCPFRRARCAPGSHGAGNASRRSTCRRKENVYERRGFFGAAAAGAAPPEPDPQGHAAL